MYITIQSHDEFSKKETRIWRAAGFKVLKNFKNEIILEIPKGWKLISEPGKDNVKSFIDGNCNIRGVYAQRYAYLYCRYQIKARSVIPKKHTYTAETCRLYIVDRKNDIDMCDMGSFEPYSDYAKDLKSLAEKWLDLNFPNWRDASCYWED